MTKEIKLELILNNQDVLPIGYRGTSFEEVRNALETGYYRPEGVKKGVKPTLAQRFYNAIRYRNPSLAIVYFWPIPENWEANGLAPPVPFEESPIDQMHWCKNFAREQSRKALFERATGISVMAYDAIKLHEADGPGDDAEIDEIIDEMRCVLQKTMEKTGVSRKQIEELYRDAIRREGFMVYLHPQAGRDLKIENDPWFDDWHEHDIRTAGKGLPNTSQAFRIRCPLGGFDVKYIAGIKPIGERSTELITEYLESRGMPKDTIERCIVQESAYH